MCVILSCPACNLSSEVTQCRSLVVGLECAVLFAAANNVCVILSCRSLVVGLECAVLFAAANNVCVILSCRSLVVGLECAVLFAAANNVCTQATQCRSIVLTAATCDVSTSLRLSRYSGQGLLAPAAPGLYGFVYCVARLLDQFPPVGEEGGIACLFAFLLSCSLACLLACGWLVCG